MRNPNRSLIDSLESRLLMSGDPEHHGPVIPPLPTNATALDQANYAAVQKDLAAVQADQAQVQTDFGALQAAIKTAMGTAPVMTAQANLKAAITAQQPLIQADLSAVKAVYVKDEPAVDAAQHQLWVDTRSGAVSTVIAADKAALASAQTALSNDLAAPQAQLKSDEAPIEAAEAALQTAIRSDPGVAAAQKTLTGDQSLLSSASKQFQTDLTTYVTDLKQGI